MAGGKFAEKIPCTVCLVDHQALVPAERTYEGDETDEYTCEKGHSFGMDWSSGPADEAQWPPSQELKDYVASQKRADREGAR